MSIINDALKKTEQSIHKLENNGLQPNSQSHWPEGRGLASDSQNHKSQGDGLASHSQSHKNSAPYILYILILVAGLFLSNFIFNLLSRWPEGRGLASHSQSHKLENNGLASHSQSHKLENNGLPSVRQSHKITSEPFPLIPPAPLLEENKVPETAFILNGIFFSDNDGYALVNNQIVRENDLVDGAKVKTITANTVELDNAGKIVTLATQR